MKFRIGKFVFEPGLWSSLAAVLLMACFLALASWQLDRAAEKRRILLEQGAANQAEPLQLAEALERQAPQLTRVTVNGHFVDDWQLLVENQIEAGRRGYHLYGLFRDRQSGADVLVNRGWLPAPPDRSRWPELPAADETRLEARIYRPAERPFNAENLSLENRESVYRIAAFDLPVIAANLQKIGYHIAPLTLRQAADPDSPLVRNWQWINMPPEKHLAYAAQWFAFALVLLILYLWLNCRREEGQ